MTLGDGVERGHPDARVPHRRGLALHASWSTGRSTSPNATIRGQAIGWHSPAGFRHPGLHDYEGEDGLGFVRSFSGLLATCGLDHILGPARGAGGQLRLSRPKATVRHSLHGRVSMIPARLDRLRRGLGRATAACCGPRGSSSRRRCSARTCTCCRRIEADVGGNEIRIRDRVVNHGFAPHAAYVLLPRQRRLSAARRRARAIWRRSARCSGPRTPASLRAQGVGYRTMRGAAAWGSASRSGSTISRADAGGGCPAAVVNDRLGLGFEVVTRKDQLPCFYEWQNYQAGHYALGIEPSTHHVLGELAARERGEMIWLEHGESRGLRATFRVLDGAGEIAAAERADRRRSPRQPEEDFPEPDRAASRRSGGGARRRARDERAAGDAEARLQPRRARARGWAVETGLASAEWYHTDVPRKAMKELMQRSDRPAIRDTVDLARRSSCCRRPGRSEFWGTWWCVPFFARLRRASTARPSDSRWHECGHGTAFRTRWMNDAVYQIACFMLMRNPVTWRWSHARHHTDTIIVGRDAEIAVMRPPDLLRAALMLHRAARLPLCAAGAGAQRLRQALADEKSYHPGDGVAAGRSGAARWHVASMSRRSRWRSALALLAAADAGRPAAALRRAGTWC